MTASAASAHRTTTIPPEENSDSDDPLQTRAGGRPRARNTRDPSTSTDRALAARHTKRCLPCFSITQGTIYTRFQKIENSLKQPKTLNIGRILATIGLTTLNAIGIAYILALNNLLQTQCKTDNNCHDAKCDLSEHLKETQITLGVEFSLAVLYLGWQLISHLMARDRTPVDEKNNAMKYIRDVIITFPLLVLNGWTAALPGNLNTSECTTEYDQIKAYDTLMIIPWLISALGMMTILIHSLAKNQGIVPTPAPQPEADALLDEEESA